MSRQLSRQWRVLLALTEQPQSVAALARQLGTTKSTIERDIRVLSTVFAVECAPSPKHKQRRMWTARFVKHGATGAEESA